MKAWRKDAIKNNLRRPWDGEDGADYEDVKNRLLGSVFTDNVAELKEKEDIKQEASFEEEGTEEDVLKPEYDWKGTDNMDQYESEAYSRYKSSHGGLTAMFNAASRFFRSM